MEHLVTTTRRLKALSDETRLRILHLLGLEHERLTFYHNGLERRLTDVAGDVIEGVLA